MKTIPDRILAVLLVVLLSFTSMIILSVNSQEEDNWTSLAHMKVDRYALGVVAENGKIYAMGGYTGGGPYLDTNEEYDPQTNTWTNKTSMPYPMGWFGITVHNGKIYCISGENGSTYAYTPLYDIWEEKAPLPNPRDGITAQTIKDKIYVIGGQSNIVDVYDPLTDMWSDTTPMPYNLSKLFGWTCTSVVFENKIHIIGDFPDTISNLIFDPTSEEWSIGDPLLSGSFYAVACATTGVKSLKRIYVFASSQPQWGLVIPSTTSQCFNPITREWDLTSRIPHGHFIGGATVIDDRIFVVGGGDAFYATAILAENNNDMYIPLGYGTPDPSYTTPASTPAPTLSPTPTPESGPDPTPTPIPEPEFPITQGLGIIITLIVGVGILVYFKKRRT